MIRYTRHQGTNYIIVDSTLEIDSMSLPVQIQVKVEGVEKENQVKVFKIISSAFNHPLNYNKPKVQPKKSWWQSIFKK